VKQDSEELQKLIDQMLETMYRANGVGLAAPQVGRLIQLFVMDSDPMTEELDEPDLGPMVFLNPEIVELVGESIEIEEGCLSIPDVRDKVKRPSGVRVRWLDRKFLPQEMLFEGWSARVVQHEYDHLLGKLFLDYLSSFRMRLHKARLSRIDAGNVETDYPLFPRSNEKNS